MKKKLSLCAALLLLRHCPATAMKPRPERKSFPASLKVLCRIIRNPRLPNNVGISAETMMHSTKYKLIDDSSVFFFQPHESNEKLPVNPFFEVNDETQTPSSILNKNARAIKLLLSEALDIFKKVFSIQDKTSSNQTKSPEVDFTCEKKSDDSIKITGFESSDLNKKYVLTYHPNGKESAETKFAKEKFYLGTEQIDMEIYAEEIPPRLCPIFKRVREEFQTSGAKKAKYTTKKPSSQANK